MESLDTWWDGLTLVHQFFYAIGIVATAVLAVQVVLTLIGADGHDADGADTIAVDGHEIPDGDADVGLLSVRTVTAFLVGFGWVGAFLLRTGFPLFLTVPIAFAAGLAMLFGIFYTLKLLWSLRESGTLDYHNAVGQIGAVYLPIPGERKGKGQIEVMIQGRLQVVPAETSRPGPLANRSRVLVVDRLEDNTLLVVPDESPETT